MSTLPNGWTGNTADHHAKIGAFRVVVRRVSKREQRWRWEIQLGLSAVRGDGFGEATPDAARVAACTRLQSLTADVVSSPILFDAGLAVSRLLVEPDDIALLRRVFTDYRGAMVQKPRDHACAECCADFCLNAENVDPAWTCSYHEAVRRLGLGVTVRERGTPAG